MEFKCILHTLAEWIHACFAHLGSEYALMLCVLRYELRYGPTDAEMGAVPLGGCRDAAPSGALAAPGGWGRKSIPFSYSSLGNKGQL